MAKRKGFKKARTVTRYIKSKARRKGGRSSGFGKIGNIFNSLPILAFGYGIIRTPIANAIQPLTSKLPLGEYSDEVGLALAGYFMSKQSGMLGKLGDNMLTIEGYRAGELTSSRVITGNSSVAGVKDAYYV